MNTPDSAHATVKVWDPLLRIFHWTLVAAFVVAYVTGDEWERFHIWAGYLIMGLLLFRLVWGFVGPKHARFADFLYSPSEILAYLKALPTGKAKRYLGHNPAGGAMVFLLLASLAATTLTGLAMDEQLFSSPSTASVHWFEEDEEGEELWEEIHEFFANFTLLLVLLHIAGVIVSSRLHDENLVRAMITGRKPVHPDNK